MMHYDDYIFNNCIVSVILIMFSCNVRRKKRGVLSTMAEYRKWTEEELDALRPPVGKTGIKWPLLFLLTENAFGNKSVVDTNYRTTLRTDILKIPLTAQAATSPIGTVAGVIWSFIQPLVLQRVTLPWGKARSWLLVCPIICWLGETLIEGPLGIGWLPHLIIFTTLGMILNWMGTLSDINLALTGVKVAGKNEALQTSFSINKGRGGYINSIVFGLFNTAVVNLSTKLLGYDNFVRGSFFIFMAWYFIMMSLIFARFAKPFDPPTTKEERQASRVNASGKKGGGLVESLKLVGTNGPLLTCVIAYIFLYLYIMGPFSFAFYYFRYHVQNMRGMSLQSTFTGIANIIGTYILGFALKKIPKKTAMVISGYWPLVVMLVCYLTNFKNTMWGYIGCKCVCNLFGVGGNSMITSNFRDAATYTEWKTGENVASLCLGCIPIPLQIMGLIKGVMDPLLLKSANYSEAAIQAEVAAGDHTMSTKIAFFYMVIPAISSAIFATIMLLFFPGTKKFDQWRAEIEARKAEQKETADA